MKTVQTFGITTCTLAASLLFLTIGCNANPASSAAASPPSTPATAPGKPAAPEAKSPVNVIPDADTNSHNNWTAEQILTCTVSQCWQLSGKNEDNFFDIVQQLAVISAKNRNLTLPQTEAAGEKTGQYIKDQARKDRQQLLYAVVDDAIRKVGTPSQSN